MADDASLRIFISYARADISVVDEMVRSLEANGFAVSIDRRDLPYGEAWQQELSDFIAMSDTVVWLVSPSSIASRWVNWELGEVMRLAKRLVPVKIADVDVETLPETLGRIHMLPASGNYAPDIHAPDLFAALHANNAWLKKGTALSADARDWQFSDREPALLLRGQALTAAQTWAENPPPMVPPVSSAVLEYILASRRANDRRRRFVLTGSIAASAIAVSLAGVSVWSALIARERETIALRNETVSLTALSEVALAQGSPVEALKLALAAWPRNEADRRQATTGAIERINAALVHVAERRRLPAHEGSVNSVRYSPDGRHVVTAGSDGAVIVSDVANRTEVVRLRSENENVEDATFSADGRYIVTGTTQSPANVWEFPSGLHVLTMKTALGFGMYDLSVSSDGRTLATAPGDDSVSLWNLASGEKSLSCRIGDSVIRVVEFSPDGRKLAIGSDDGMVRLLDPTDCTVVAELKGNTDRIWSVRFSADGETLNTAAADDTIRRWQVRDGLAASRIDTGDFTPLDVAQSPDGTVLAAAGNDGSLHLYETSSGILLETLQGHEGAVRSVDFAPDGRAIVSGGSDGTTRIWRPSVLVARRIPLALPEGNLAIFSPDGTRMLIASKNDAWIVNAATGERLTTLSGHLERITDVAFAPDGKRAMTCSFDHTARIWDLTGSGPFLEITGHGGPVTACAFSHDGKLAATGSTDMTVRFTNAETGKPEGTLKIDDDEPNIRDVFEATGVIVETNSIDSISFDAAGEVMTVTTAYFVARDYGLNDRKELRRRFPVAQTVYAPSDGHFTVATISSARISEGSAPPWISRQIEHGSYLMRSKFNDEATRYFTHSLGAPPRIWDSPSGIEILEFSTTSDIETADMSNDGASLVITDSKSRISLFDISALESGNAMEIACTRLGSNTGLQDIELRYGLNDLPPICTGNVPAPFAGNIE